MKAFSLLKKTGPWLKKKKNRKLSYVGTAERNNIKSIWAIACYNHEID